MSIENMCKRALRYRTHVR